MDIFMNNRGYVGFSHAVLLALFAVSIVSCQGRGSATPIEVPTTPTQGQTAVGEQREPVPMPSPLEALRGSSGGLFGVVRPGAAFGEGLVHNRVDTAGNRLIFNPSSFSDGSLDRSAFAIYHFNLGAYSGGHSFTTSWANGFSNWDNLYLGLSDWDNDKWDWQQTENGLLTDPSALTPYLDQNQHLLVVVLLSGGQDGNLEWLLPGNYPDTPIANLTASTVFGDAPLRVVFDATESTFPTGTPLYEWDQDGDGIYEDQNTSGTWTTTYDESGEFAATVRVSFGTGISDTASVEIDVRDNALLLSADYQDGDWDFVTGNGSSAWPHMLNIDATRSDYTFKVLNIDSIEYVPLDSLTWHFIPPGEQPVEMVAPGVIHSTSVGGAIIYASDNEGHQSNFKYVEVIPFDGEPLVACFNESVTTGDYPLRVEFDFSCTTGEGGVGSLWYEWDFDGDGILDMAHQGMLYGVIPQPAHVYHEAGDYEVELTVFDESGNWDVANTTISVTGSGSRWHFDELAELASSGIAGLVEINDKPGLFTSSFGYSPHYYSAINSLGTLWNDPVSIFTNPDYHFSPPVVGVIDGFPALFMSWEADWTWDSGVNYIEALDPEGTQWGEPQPIIEYQDYLAGDFLVCDGHPCVVANNSYSVSFFGYDGVSGDNGWYTANVFQGDERENANATLVDGKPAFVYSHFSQASGNYKLEYIRAADAAGKTWGSPTTLLEGTLQRGLSLEVINGLPAISFIDGSDDNLKAKYMVSLDATGTAWDTPVEICPAATKEDPMSTELLEWNSTPFVFIDDGEGVSCSLAQDSSGSAWGTKKPVGGLLDYWEFLNVEIVNGIPTCAFIRPEVDDWKGNNELVPQKLFFGTYY